MMVQYLTEVLEGRIFKARKHPYSLKVRVSIANQLVNSTLWYMLQLWMGDTTQLERFDGMIKDFIWSGQEFSKRP